MTFQSKQEAEIAKIAKLVRVRDKAEIRKRKGLIDIPYQFVLYGGGKGRFPVPKIIGELFEDREELEIILVRSAEELEALSFLGDLKRFPFVIYLKASTKGAKGLE